MLIHCPVWVLALAYSHMRVFNFPITLCQLKKKIEKCLYNMEYYVAVQHLLRVSPDCYFSLSHMDHFMLAWAFAMLS